MTREETTAKLISAKNTVVELEEELKVYDRYGSFTEVKEHLNTNYYIRVSNITFNRTIEPSLMCVHLREEPYGMIEDIVVKFPNLRLQNVSRSKDGGICILIYSIR